MARGEGVEVQAQSAHAGLVHALQVGERRLRRDHRDATPARAELGERREHRAIVGAVAARLDEHGALETDLRLHALVGRERRLGHVVGALGRERKVLERTEDMHVAVGGVRRHRRGRRAVRAVERLHSPIISAMKKLIVLCALIAGAAGAQEYPAKPVRVIVPYAAGGNADIWARTLAQKLGEAMRQAFVVENKPGANGGLGTDFVAKSAPDGYTLLAVASGPIVVNPVLYAQVPYDPLRDLTPVAQCTLYQYVLVTRADAPYKSIQDLVGDARARPGAL